MTTMITAASPSPIPDPHRDLWREVLAAAFNHDDDTWRLGEGGEWLLDLVLALMHPREEADVPAVSDDQLRAALAAMAAAEVRS